MIVGVLALLVGFVVRRPYSAPPPNSLDRQLDAVCRYGGFSLIVIGALAAILGFFSEVLR